MVLENAFDRGDEIDADKVVGDAGAEGRLRAGDARRLPDAPRRPQQGSAGAATACSRRIPRRRSASTRSASWPATKPAPSARRATSRTSSTQPTPITAIAAVEDGAAGLTGSDGAAAKDDKSKAKRRGAEEEGLRRSAALKQTVAPEKQTAQVVGVGRIPRSSVPTAPPKGGSNPRCEGRDVSDAEVAAFRARELRDEPEVRSRQLSAVPN